MKPENRKKARIRDSTFMRMVVGYLIIVCVPIGFFCVIYINMLGQQMQTSYSNQKQQWVNQGVSNLNVQLQQVEHSYNILQTNRIFTEYLAYRGGDVERIYQYIKYINSCFTEVKAANTYITEVRFYTDNSYLLRLLSEFRPYPMGLDGNPEYRKGKWEHRPATAEAAGAFVYRRYVNGSDYRRQMGVLEIIVSEEIVFPNFLVEADDDSMERVAAFVDNEGNILKRRWSTGGEDLLDNAAYAGMLSALGRKSGYAFADSGSGVLYTGYVPELDIYYVEIEEYADGNGWNWNMPQIFRLVFPSLLLFSLFYYLIIARFLSRIRRLTGHIHHRGNRLEPIETDTKGDEIGYLYQAYNALILNVKELIQSLRNEENLRREAAYNAMQTKIQPHFLYGTLETIRMMAIKNGDKETAALTYSFSKLMRYSLGSAPEVTLQQELDHIRDYLAIQVRRLEPRLAVAYDINVPAETIRCPFFILQPVVENAVAHGLANCTQRGMIHVLAHQVDEDFAEIIIRDNGTGIEAERLASIRSTLQGEGPLQSGGDADRNGMALHNVHERLKYYYGPACGIEVRSEPGKGTTVVVRVRMSREEASGHEDPDSGRRDDYP